jgi:glycine C-acetyltransferase
MVGEAQHAKDFSAALFEAGVFAQAIAFPTVPRGTARLRLMVSATHRREDLEFALQTLAETGRTCGILSGVAKTS